MTWTNDGRPFLVNALITEFDIQHGNTSIMREFSLRPNDVMDQLDTLPKDERNRQVGLMQRDDKQFGKDLEAGFNEAVNRFIEANELDRDIDVLAIRRDAVFVVNHPITTTQIGKHINFVAKNEYHAGLQIGRYEFYFKSDGTIDIKNFVQRDKDVTGCLDRLAPGMLSFLQEFVDECEGCNMNRRVVYNWLRDFITAYKDRQLDIEYYREFTRDALFAVHVDDAMMYTDRVTPDLFDDLEISFNYTNIIIPLLQILI